MTQVGYFVFSLWEDSETPFNSNILKNETLDEIAITDILKKRIQGFSTPYKIFLPKPVKYNGLRDWERKTGFRCSVVIQEPYPSLLYLNQETFQKTFLEIESIVRQTFPSLFIPVRLLRKYPACKLDRILD